MAEGLSHSITVDLHANKLSGLQPHASAPPSTHQQFVDDTLLMGLPTIREASSIKTIFLTFLRPLAPPSTLRNPRCYSLTPLYLSTRTLPDSLISPLAPSPPTTLGFP